MFSSHYFFLFWAASCTFDSRAQFADSRVSCFFILGAGQEPVSPSLRPQARPLGGEHVCPLRLAVRAAMAAAALMALLALQPGARTLRAFSTAVSQATPSPRECLPRCLRAVGEVRGRETGPTMAAAVAEPAPPWGGRYVLSLLLARQ